MEANRKHEAAPDLLEALRKHECELAVEYAGERWSITQAWMAPGGKGAYYDLGLGWMVRYAALALAEKYARRRAGAGRALDGNPRQ